MIKKILNKILLTLKLDVKSKSAKEYCTENKKVINAKHNHVDGLDVKLSDFYSQGGITGGFALTESSLKCLIYNLLKKTARVLQNTRIWRRTINIILGYLC